MNRDGGGKPGRAGRQITAEEAELWHQISHSIDKVKTKPRVAKHGADATSDTPSPAAPAPRPRLPRIGAGPVPAAVLPAPPPGRPPPPAELDRRALRQVSTGKVAIDAVLDLHGLNQDTAFSRLRGFLVSSQARGHRMVLVITGKGAATGRHESGPFGDAPRGVLRRSVPLWLEEAELRAVVLSYASAGVRHGGEGALYIRLRKLRGA